MTVERKDLNLKGMVRVDYFKYSDDISNPGVYMEIRFKELISSRLYEELTRTTNGVFSSVSDSIRVCSFRGLFSFLKELNGIDYYDNSFIISFMSSELLNDVSIDTLTLYGIDDSSYNLLNDLLDIVDPLDKNKNKFNVNDLKKAIYRSELCLPFNLESLKIIENTIKVFGRLLFNALDILSEKYIKEEVYK